MSRDPEPSPPSPPSLDEDPEAALHPKPGRTWVRILKFVVRWTIAIVAIAWIVSNLTIRDHVLVVGDDNVPRRAAVIAPAEVDDLSGLSSLAVEFDDGTIETVPTADVINGPDRDDVTIDGKTYELLGMRIGGDFNRNPIVTSLLIRDGEQGRWVDPARTDYTVRVPQPLVEVGLRHLIRDADPLLLLLGLAIFPLNFFLTAWRWQRLLAAIGLHVPYKRALVLTMVGQFYSSFLPGNTGGDVIKAVYAARQTTDRATGGRAVVSVFVDRVIGLVALVILGGVAASLAWAWAGPGTPTAATCQQVLIVCATILIVSLGTMLYLASRATGRGLPFKELRAKLPGHGLATKAFDTMTLYARRPGLILWGMAVTLPVHLTVALTGALGGMAFGLPVATGYYFVVVPVIVLVGSIPVSPQGAGVMEFFAVTLLNRQGVTIGEAFALTLFIRFAHVAWYLVGGLWVLKGGYGQAIDANDDPPQPAVA